MLKIRYPEGLIEKLHYSNYEDYATYPDSVFTCDKCGYKVRFAYKDLEKHRFSKASNLTGQDKIMADRE